jgi:hypothetical protein
MKIVRRRDGTVWRDGQQIGVIKRVVQEPWNQRWSGTWIVWDVYDVAGTHLGCQFSLASAKRSLDQQTWSES